MDEYDGDFLSEPTEMASDQPLTLGEVTDFLLNAFSLVDALEMNFENDLEFALDFFFVESRFYPDLGRLCVQRVIESFPAKKDEQTEEL